jgi:hypothetical protein
LGRHIFCHLDNNLGRSDTETSLDKPLTRAARVIDLGKILSGGPLNKLDASLKAKDKSRIFIGLSPVEWLKPVRMIANSDLEDECATGDVFFATVCFASIGHCSPGSVPAAMTGVHALSAFKAALYL